MRNIKQTLCSKHTSSKANSQNVEGEEGLLEKLSDDSQTTGNISNLLRNAEVVVAGGYGVGSRNNFQMLYKLAEVLHGQVGATRAAIDAGFCDRDIMIGSTGITVHPKLYIACGISGARQHTSGIKDCGKLISINTDAEAPINKLADKFIQGRIEDVLPQLIMDYKNILL